MAVSTQTGILASARTTTGRDQVDLALLPSTIIVFIYITGGTATVDIEVADVSTATPIAVASVTATSVVVLGIPASQISTNVTAISGATVNSSYRNYVGGDPPSSPVTVYGTGSATIPSVTPTIIVTSSPGQAGTRYYGPAQPGTGNATLVTASGKIRIKTIHVANTTASAATISLAINGTAATAANCFIKGYSVPAQGTYDWTGEIVLADTDTIQGLQGTGSALTVIISGEASI